MMAEAPITIVGLGPGDPDRRTVAVQRALDDASRIIVRTLEHPGLDDLRNDPRVTTAAEIMGEDDEHSWAAVASRVVDIAIDTPVVLAVPGNPRFGERLVIETVQEAERRSIPVDILEGLSALDLMTASVTIDAMVEEVQVVDGKATVERIGEGPFGGGQFPFTPLRPLLISRLYTPGIMQGMQTLLARLFPLDHRMVLIETAGFADESEVRDLSLTDLTGEAGGPRTSLYVPAMAPLEATRDPRTLQHIVARLRAPDGCPWDRKQDHRSLRDAVLDEAYEAVDAIDADDDANLAEELGDLFLLIAMHAQIAEEAGTFTLEDVYQSITEKIVRRHPHVFGEAQAHDPDAAIRTWHEIKAQERAENGAPRREKPMDGLPASMPALTRAQRVLTKQPRSADNVGVPEHDPGAALFSAVADLIEAGENPDRALRETIERYVTQSE